MRTIAKPWVEHVARFSFVAKGLVYLVIGGLALRAAVGQGTETMDVQGALATIAAQAYGVVALGVVAAGLISYALWRFVEAFTDPESKGTAVSGLATRASYVAIGVFYAGLGLFAARLVQRQIPGGAGNIEESWTRLLLQQPLGRWLVAALGMGIIAFFLGQIYRAFSGAFPERLRAGDLRGAEAIWARRIGIFGLVARGIVFGLSGFFLIQAGLQYDPALAGGLDQALQLLGRRPYGPLFLGSAAAGLFAYGLYMVLIAWYRRRFAA